MREISNDPAELTESQFEEISGFVKDLCGINLHDGKKELVKARLSKRIRLLGMKSFEQYMNHVREDSSNGELVAMLDALSTNLTYFFREAQHFDYLRDHAIPRIVTTNRTSKRLRIWSSGCSTGEEPYSLAILLNECVNDLSLWDAAILATDLSTRVLNTAAAGTYAPERLKDVPHAIINEYFVKGQTHDGVVYQVHNKIKRLVHFARLNLMESWPMHGPFDIIFCRNVMIYFDKPTQARLVQRYFDILAHGGILCVGHAESLTGIKHEYKYVLPAIYQKP